MADLQVENTTESYLKWDKRGVGVGLRVRIRNEELASIHLLVDKNKGSSLPENWDSLQIKGGVSVLKVLRDYCEEAIVEIEKRVKGRNDQFSLG